MLEIQGAIRKSYCDRTARRDFLRIGALSFGGLTLTDLLRLQAPAQAAAPANARSGAAWGKAGILIWLGGGPSHLETFDPKPTAPSDIRGPFGAISTKIPGLQIGELFPKLSTIADKFSVVRSCCHENSGHGGGQRWVMTGYNSRSPEFELPHDYPNVGSVIARMKGGNRRGMPAFTAVPPSNLHENSAAYLGAAYNPMQIYSNGRPTGLSLNQLIPAERLQERRELRASLDRLRRHGDLQRTMGAMDDLEAQALEMVTGGAVQTAFDLDKETPAIREQYGKHNLGNSCLLARRMIEAGTTFVTVSMGDWDQHGSAGGSIADKYPQHCPMVDQAVSALLLDLDQRGLLQDTVVYLLGEFGRTPRINNTGGRDHWPQAMSVLMAGGGLQSGQVVGATTRKGEYPIDRALSPADILATVYHTFGIDYRKEFTNSEGRPTILLDEGRPIRELT